MPVDPQNPDTYDDADVRNTAAADGSATDEDVEAPEADAAEQRTELDPRGDAPLSEHAATEADPADAAEQARVVELNEDEYRS